MPDASTFDRPPGDRIEAARRRARLPLVQHVEATSRLVGFTMVDQAYVDLSARLLRPRLQEIARTVWEALLEEPEMAADLASADGSLDAGLFARRLAWCEAWLGLLIEQPLGEPAIEQLASLAHDTLRPRDPRERPLRATHLLCALSRAESLVVEALMQGIADPEELALCTSAWCKRFMIQFDLVLSVYSAGERRIHWY